MKQAWQDYEKAAERGPMAIAVKVILAVFALGIFVSVIGYSLGWFGEAAKVAREEFGPRAALEKYEWFKDAAAQLDKKKADITVFEKRVKDLFDAYKDVPRKDWPRDERENLRIWEQEVAGIKASFNGLAADYNAQMTKFNWRFANAGELPKGATEPLPREFKPYIVN